MNTKPKARNPNMPDEEWKQTSQLVLFIPEDKRAEQHCGKNAKIKGTAVIQIFLA